MWHSNYPVLKGGRIMDINTKTNNGIYDLSLEEIKAIETLIGAEIELDTDILTLMGKTSTKEV